MLSPPLRLIRSCDGLFEVGLERSKHFGGVLYFNRFCNIDNIKANNINLRRFELFPNCPTAPCRRRTADNLVTGCEILVHSVVDHFQLAGELGKIFSGNSFAIAFLGEFQASCTLRRQTGL